MSEIMNENISENTNENRNIYIDLEEIEKLMKPVHWLAFDTIVSMGISKEKEAKRAIVDDLVIKIDDCVSEDSAWRYIKHLVALRLFTVQRIDTGYRKFNVLLLTEIGRKIYMLHFRKKIPEAEADMVIREHANLHHGYMIMDAAMLLKELDFYTTITTSRKTNFIRLEKGNALIPDIIATFADCSDYFEVECGNHKQKDFNEKCSKIASVTDKIIFIGRSFDAITNILKPQIEKWINSVGRESLRQHNKSVCLASIVDIKKNRWSYVFDMESKEPHRNIPIIERELLGDESEIYQYWK